MRADVCFDAPMKGATARGEDQRTTLAHSHAGSPSLANRDQVQKAQPDVPPPKSYAGLCTNRTL